MLTRFLAGSILALFIMNCSARAGDEEDCLSSESAAGVAACTRLIEVPNQEQDLLIAARHKRALLNLASQQYAAARSDLDAALLLSPKNPEIQSDRAAVRCQVKDYKGAAADFAAALQGDAASEHARYNRAVCYLRQRKFSDAIKDFEAATQSNRQDSQAYYGQYLAYAETKDAKRAISAHYVAIQISADVASKPLEFRYSDASPSTPSTRSGGRAKKAGKRAKKKGYNCPGYAPWDPQKGQCVNDKTKQVVTTHEVSIFFGTDRSPNAGGERLTFGKQRAGALTLGRADVSVPVYRNVGEIERPWSATSTALHIIGKAENPAKYYVVQQITKLGKPEFLAGVADALLSSTDFKGQGFVFVHGYNVSFDDALYRAAQIAADSGFDGVPFVYSWPSAGELRPYEDDRKSAEQAVQHLRAFLESIATETGVEKVHVIAHSMGSVVTLNALKLLAEANASPARAKFSEIILAAPDFDTSQFKTILEAMASFGEGKTLYASSQDLALRASMLGWGGDRAGNVPANGPLVMPGVATIDVSAVNTNILGHSTYADEMKLLIDIGILLKGQRKLFGAPKSRIPLLYPGNASGGAYWIWPR